MKKLFLFIIFMIFTCFNAAFCDVEIEGDGAVKINSNEVSTTIKITIDNFVSATLAIKVTPQEQTIKNTTNSSYSIPVSQLYFVDNNKKEYPMSYNTEVNIASGINISIGSYIQYYDCVIKNIGVLPSGKYTTKLLFDTYSTLSSVKTPYVLTFEIQPSQTVSSTVNPVNITLTPDNVFDGNATIENTTSPQIRFQSNGKWKLILDTANLGTLPANYYFLITGVSSHVTSYITEQTKIEPNKQYVLASGTATVTAPVTGSYVTDYINIKYSLKNTSGTYIPEGTYNNTLKYTIEKGDN